jgi:hypothetical protein
VRVALTRMLALTFVLACSGACGGVPDIASVPAQPTWTNDVQPLLADHCTLCHGSPPNRGAPADFRLDVYDDVGSVRGAFSEASTIVHVVNSGAMPPGGAMGPNGKALLQLWLTNGAPR